MPRLLLILASLLAYALPVLTPFVVRAWVIADAATARDGRLWDQPTARRRLVTAILGGGLLALLVGLGVLAGLRTSGTLPQGVQLRSFALSSLRLTGTTLLIAWIVTMRPRRAEERRSPTP